MTPLQLKCGEGDGVWPELMPFAVGQGDEDRLRPGCSAPSDENAEKAALGNGTGGELGPERRRIRRRSYDVTTIVTATLSGLGRPR